MYFKTIMEPYIMSCKSTFYLISSSIYAHYVCQPQQNKKQKQNMSLGTMN